VGKVTAIGSWVGYVAVLAASLRVILSWRTNRSLHLLGVGVLAFLVADFFYGRTLLDGAWATGTLIDLGFFAFNVLCGAAALLPSMSSVTSAPYTRHQLGPVRLTMVALALLVAPTALLVEATAGPVTTGIAIALVSAAIAVVILVRLFLTARAYQRRAAREQAVRLASRALVRATTETDVTTALQAALREMGAADGTVGIVALDPDRAARTRFELRPDGSTGDLVVPLTNDVPLEAVVFTGRMTELTELAPSLYVMADQAASALQRIRLVAQLRTEERERYFRTLVLTSSDVTLISRNGRIVYATPSAREMFGRDVTGDLFDDIVKASPQGNGDRGSWSETAYEEEGYVHRPAGTATVVMRRRDLTHDPTVGGVVTTLRDVTAERQLRQDLAFRATHDPLTGLANTQLFSEMLRAEERSGDGGGSAVLFVDLDDFKAVNDFYGHEVGDYLLTEAARRIGSCIDSRNVVARLGGDEFGVLLRDVGVNDARAAAQCIADELGRPAVVEHTVLDSSASVGLAFAPRSTAATELLREADIALYSAKAHGKGRWRQYRKGMTAPVRQQAEERRRLREALDGGRFHVYYQPIVEAVTGHPVGFEALLRPDAPVAAGLSPEEFVSLAEDAGLIGMLGEWVLGRALADLPRLDPCYISVNVSARQLRQADFVDLVRGRLAVTGVDPSRLVLEITENTLIARDDERSWDFLGQLRGDGVRIAIDDYGTGFASMSYLRQTSIDIVKLDQSFLTDLSPRNRTLVAAVSEVFRRVGLVQIAEGVEDRSRRDVVVEAGCPYGQGYYYGEAMPIDEAVAYLARRL
jgi:diguanylate cyclase (GGDEF)-like protein